MQISSRFTLAIHSMLCIAYFTNIKKCTSNFIAQSTSSNPVIIRKLLGQLKEAKLVEIKAGVGGAVIVKSLDKITLYDIFKAVDVVQNSFFNIHDNSKCKCILGKNIRPILDKHLVLIEESMNSYMKKTTLKMLLDEVNFPI